MPHHLESLAPRRTVMRHVAALALLAAGLAAGAGTALAQPAWPSRPVTIVVAYPAGGGVDFVARKLAERLGAEMGQQIVVENRAGASGSLGAGLVARAKADGYMLLLASPAEVIVGPSAGQKVPYDPKSAFEPVALVGETPLGIAAHASVEAKDLPALLRLARGSDKLAYGTPGAGSSMHFAGETFNKLAGASMLHVPYKGAAPAVNDLLGGQVPLAIVGLPPLMAHAKAGRIRLLAVTTAQRSTALPDVPAVAELPGFAGYRFSNWMGLYAPAGTTAPVVERLAGLVSKIVAEPAVRSALVGAGVEPRGLGRAEFEQFLRAERERYESIARERSIRFSDTP